MTLCLVGRGMLHGSLSLSLSFFLSFLSRCLHQNPVCIESCEDLKKWAVEKFSDIANKSIEVPSWKAPIYGEEQLGKVIKFVPVKNERSFEIVWPIPAQTPKYLTKPSQFLSHLLGHEGPGSLLSLLKAKGWAEQLCAGSMRRGSNFALFQCEVTLTEEGLKHTDEIGADIYRYLDMLRSNDYQGVQEWMHDETAAIADSNFRFKDTERPRAYAPHVAQAMQKYPPEHTLGGGSLHYEYNRQDIIDVLQLLTVDNSLVFIGAPDFGGQLDRKEQWYQTEHSVTPFTPEQRGTWTAPRADSRLALPEPNPFIATDFTVHPVSENAPVHPLLIRKDDKVYLWFKQDNVFRKPKASVKFKLESPVVYSSPLTTVKSLLFTRLVEDALNEYSYYAELASLRYSISHARTGIRFNIRGYNEKLHVLALKALEQLVNFKVDPQRFELIKAEIIREYENMKLNQPYQHCIYDQRCAIEAVRWTIPEYLAVVHDITCQDIQDFVPAILETYRAECFIHGNFTKDKALEFMELAEGVLKGRTPKVYERPVPQRIVNLLPRHEYILARPVPNPENKNCAVQVYWQIGPETFREIVLMDVLRQIAKTAAFEQLRTKEQLGYLVWAQAGTDNSVQSFNVIVQSSEHDASYLDQRIELWAESFAQDLEDLPEDKFAAYVQAVVDAKREKDKTMLEETRRWWNEIVENHYIFDRVEIECAELSKLTKNDLVNFYKEYIPAAAPKRSRLSVHYYGCNHEIPSTVLSTPTAQGDAAQDITVVPVNDLYQFKDTLPMYPAKVFDTPIDKLTDLE
eukprot:TRINITY_DN5224_c0_g1_i14.p1 TRINITY_DN5224_c0_g1~~TRINITY_DN5224_c0_g1_i14.p1  ORF type:complete len:886 (+),score=217.98 TRINITY_DN5224_c0_g1_i14:269-2659(+)